MALNEHNGSAAATGFHCDALDPRVTRSSNRFDELAVLAVALFEIAHDDLDDEASELMVARLSMRAVLDLRPMI